MEEISKIPATDKEIDAESPYTIKVDDIIINTKMLTAKEYEEFEAKFRYSIYSTLFLTDEKFDIDKELYAILKEDLQKIRMKPYYELIKSLVAYSEIFREHTPDPSSREHTPDPSSRGEQEKNSPSLEGARGSSSNVKGQGVDNIDYVEVLYNHKNLTQEDVIKWALSILKYNITYKKKLLNILKKGEYPVESSTISECTSSSFEMGDFQTIGELLSNT